MNEEFNGGEFQTDEEIFAELERLGGFETDDDLEVVTTNLTEKEFADCVATHTAKMGQSEEAFWVVVADLRGSGKSNGDIVKRLTEVFKDEKIAQKIARDAKAYHQRVTIGKVLGEMPDDEVKPAIITAFYQGRPKLTKGKGKKAKTVDVLAAMDYPGWNDLRTRDMLSRSDEDGNEIRHWSDDRIVQRVNEMQKIALDHGFSFDYDHHLELATQKYQQADEETLAEWEEIRNEKARIIDDFRAKSAMCNAQHSKTFHSERGRGAKKVINFGAFDLGKLITAKRAEKAEMQFEDDEDGE